MPDLGRTRVYAGLGLLAVGLLLSLFGSSLPLGRLPGDLRFSWGRTRVFVPIATMLLLSLALTVLANVIIRVLNR
jgi:hypothetical protein